MRHQYLEMSLPNSLIFPRFEADLDAPNGLSFTCAAKRSGAASGASACWAAHYKYREDSVIHPKVLDAKTDAREPISSGR